MKLKKNHNLIIAADGSAASGKTTGAKKISKKYGLQFLSSGLLYRYASYQLIKHKPKNKIFFLKRCFSNLNLKQLTNKNLHSPEISAHTSIIAKEKKIRNILKSFQKKFASKYNKVCIQDIDLFSRWINISKKELLFTIDKFRNKNFWYKQKDKWFNKNLIFQIGNDKKGSKRISNAPVFLDNQIREKNKNEYDLVNRGWIIE